jgi:ABC-type lipoprotein release transport system permease subunit
VASFFLVGQLALSSFISKKRETAILSSLGASKSELLSIFVSENALIAILGCLISFLAILVLEKPINRMLEYFSGLFPLVEVPYLSFLGYPFLLPLLILLSILLLVIVSAYLSLRLSFGEELAKELKKE